jgi:hypothetical protein
MPGSSSEGIWTRIESIGSGELSDKSVIGHSDCTETFGGDCDDLVQTQMIAWMITDTFV